MKSVFLSFLVNIMLTSRMHMMLNLFQVPGGPAYKCLEPGDVLVCMNGEVSYAVRLTLTLLFI